MFTQELKVPSSLTERINNCYFLNGDISFRVLVKYVAFLRHLKSKILNVFADIYFSLQIFLQEGSEGRLRETQSTSLKDSMTFPTSYSSALATRIIPTLSMALALV